MQSHECGVDFARGLIPFFSVVVVSIEEAVLAATRVLGFQSRTDERRVLPSPFRPDSASFILTCLLLKDWGGPIFAAVLLGASTVEDAVDIRDLTYDSDSIFPVPNQSGVLRGLLFVAEQ